MDALSGSCRVVSSMCCKEDVVQWFLAPVFCSTNFRQAIKNILDFGIWDGSKNSAVASESPTLQPQPQPISWRYGQLLLYCMWYVEQSAVDKPVPYSQSHGAITVGSVTKTNRTTREPDLLPNAHSYAERESETQHKKKL